jgi:Domain of unknown function (DUF4159)/Prenyltransferase and squalene oxidase repeat
MSRYLALPLLFVFAGPIFGQTQPEPLVKQVKTRIAKGVHYLISKQAKDGGWETTVDDKVTDFHGGSTALCVLALLNSDGVIDDPDLEARRKKAITAGLANLRRIKEPTTTYVRSLQTMAFAEARSDRAIIEANVDWLIKARAFKNDEFIGWDYHSRPNAVATDGSNTQYAMLALWYARQAGVQVPREAWQKIHDHYRRTQDDKGFWIYSPYYSDAALKKPSLTMTVAGLCGLQIAGMELNGGREQWQANGAFKNCGVYGDDANAAKALAWITKNFTLDLPDRAYYHLYGLERAGRLTGMRFFGEHDWYREGCEFLVKRQELDGSWKSGGGWDRWPHVNTSFALLFLSKGRTPVLISKLVHGYWPRKEDDTDWNNDRNDLRHLTEHISKEELFNRKPVAWQTYDIMRALYARSHGDEPKLTDEDAVLADMLQSPILYITGHKSPANRFTGREINLIKRFVENGGFIVAEACCGSSEFDTGIKKWVKELWPDSDLEYLTSEHPAWTCWHQIRAGDPYKLMGLSVGCRTVMLYSPQDLSCYWESSRDDGRTKLAFRLGENLVAYATGRTPPMPRLTEIQIAGAEREIKIAPKRGFFRVGQIRISGTESKWQPAPKAMRNLMEHVHDTQGLEVELRTERISFTGELRRTKFLYMHGKDEIRLDKEKIDALRFNLSNGGLLLADACCGNNDFDKAFRKFAQELFPKEKLVLLSTDPMNRDRLYGEDLNGKDNTLSRSTIKCRTKTSGPMEPMEPHLEGIKLDGRWVVLYSKYDLGCALERNTAADCRGYDYPSAMRIATAAVLYNARP